MYAPVLAFVIYSIYIVFNSIYNLSYNDVQISPTGLKVSFYSIILNNLSFQHTDTVDGSGRVLLSGSGPGPVLSLISGSVLCAGVQPEQHLQPGLREDPAAWLQARRSHDAPGAVALLAV